MSAILKAQQTADLAADSYVLDEQIGFLLRRANQRHLGIFNNAMPDNLTAQQFAVLVRVQELGVVSQNELGRQAAMDQSTINGVVQRLTARGLIKRAKSQQDQRRVLFSLTETGQKLLDQVIPLAQEISSMTTARLTEAERKSLIRLLGKIV